MKNSDRFNDLINEFLQKDLKYKNELKNFQQYLKDRMLEEKVFNLNVNHIIEVTKMEYITKNII